MTLHPTVAKRAQEELDSVVGNDRLPGFEDRDELPYLNALVKEVFRWNSVAPLGKSFAFFLLFILIYCSRVFSAVPHRAMQDDIHDGYFIPKGSLVIPNVW